MSSNPEIANSIQTGAFKTNYHDVGQGDHCFSFTAVVQALPPGQTGAWSFPRWQNSIE